MLRGGMPVDADAAAITLMMRYASADFAATRHFCSAAAAYASLRYRPDVARCRPLRNMMLPTPLCHDIRLRRYDMHMRRVSMLPIDTLRYPPRCQRRSVLCAVVILSGRLRVAAPYFAESPFCYFALMVVDSAFVLYFDFAADKMIYVER